MVFHQLDHFFQQCQVMGLDPLCHSFQQPSGELLQNRSVNDIIILSLGQQPPLAGIAELLCKDKWVAMLTECQRTKVVTTLFQSVTNPLQDSPLEVQLVEQVADGELLGRELGIP